MPPRSTHNASSAAQVGGPARKRSGQHGRRIFVIVTVGRQLLMLVSLVSRCDCFISRCPNLLLAFTTATFALDCLRYDASQLTRAQVTAACLSCHSRMAQLVFADVWVSRCVSSHQPRFIYGTAISLAFMHRDETCTVGIAVPTNACNQRHWIFPGTSMHEDEDRLPERLVSDLRLARCKEQTPTCFRHRKPDPHRAWL